MAHYHEVYFNEHTNDGPRVGATRRYKTQIVRERIAARRVGRFVHPGAEIVRCDRPDDQCPWTVDGVPGDTTPRCPCGNLLIGDDQVALGRCDFHEGD